MHSPRRFFLRLTLIVAFGSLPVMAEVSLDQIFPDWDAWENEVRTLEGSITAFDEMRRERFERPDELLKALSIRDDVYRHARVVEGYVYIRLELDGSDAEALQRQAKLDEVDRAWSSASNWFSEAVVASGMDTVTEWSSPGGKLHKYEYFLRRLARGRQHATPPDAGLETARRLRRQIGRALQLVSTVEVFEPKATLSDGTTITLTPALARTILWETADAADRRTIQKAWLESLEKRAETCATLLEGVVVYEKAAAKARGFDDTLDAHLFFDAIPPQAIRTAIDMARTGTEPLRRYHRIRRAALMLEHYGTADRFVPIGGDSRVFTFEEARALVIESASTLGPEIQETVKRAFDEDWIDTEERPGKRVHGGATQVYREHPYVLVNFRGNLNSLFQLAHEVGHAVHAYQADRNQPWIYAYYSSLTGETVASLHEGALVDLLTRQADTDAERREVSFLDIQYLLLLFYRPALDAHFELSLYDDSTGITGASLGGRYRKTLETYYGDSIAYEEWDQSGWMEPPHFYRSPLYMGRYTLASSAAMALLSRLTGPEDERASAKKDLLTLLRAGASDDPFVLLREAGADLSDPGTVHAIVTRMDHLVTSLEIAMRDGATD